MGKIVARIFYCAVPAGIAFILTLMFALAGGMAYPHALAAASIMGLAGFGFGWDVTKEPDHA